MNYDRTYYSHDAEMRSMRDRTVLTLFFLAIGVGIGATLALLFAPSSGKTNRHNIAKTIEEGLRSGHKNVEPMVKRIEEELVGLRRNVEVHLT